MAFNNELWFFWRDRAAVLWCAVALLASAAAVGVGVQEVRSQRAEIDRLEATDAVARQEALQGQSDWGGAAYYAFHLTYDPPSAFAFAAMGQRDVAPWKHRIRMLALEGQIYESDVAPPTPSLIGRLDFAFVASVLAPLLVILLLHDLRTRERTSGRFEVLAVTVANPGRLWLRRGALRIGALLSCLLVPLAIGALWEGGSPATLALAGGAVAAHLAFWWWLTDAVDRRARSSEVALMTLTGLWLLFAVLVPPAVQAVVDRAVPVPRGAEILLAQRETVNGAWDLPKAATMDRFVESHPEWRDHALIERPFEWKWYFAFQQVGDESVAELSRAYRAGRARRDELAGRLAWLSPPALLERSLQSLAQTDASAALAYETSVREFHAALRAYYYPRIFRERPFDGGSSVPQFAPPAAPP